MAQQRVVLVTGGMGGLGETISTKMADAGYKVVVTYSPGNKAHGEWVSSMKGKGYDILAVACDVADYDSCVKAVAEVQAKVGAVDILVNNAGITRDTTFKKMDKVNWDAVLRTNLDSLFNMTKQVADGMAERGWGQLFGGQGRCARLHQGAGARDGQAGRDRQHHLAGLHRHEDGHGDPEGSPGHEDPAAHPSWAAWQARGSRRVDHLSRLRRGGLRDGRQHRHQRRPAHAVSMHNPQSPSRSTE
jgi:NAD(P)-dependent dehydrogenase (short-subunit alcohol dehydrogenase family)